jgi:hypothetical protein
MSAHADEISHGRPDVPNQRMGNRKTKIRHSGGGETGTAAAVLTRGVERHGLKITVDGLSQSVRR